MHGLLLKIYAKILWHGQTWYVFIEQESVSALLERRGWFGDREDFSVILQSSPVHTELSNPVSLQHSF